MKRYKFWRKFKGGVWYKHQFTRDANELSFPQGKTWWARYGKIIDILMLLKQRTTLSKFYVFLYNDLYMISGVN